MKTDALFYEQQSFRQWWVWLLLIGLNVLFVFGIYQQIFKGEAFGDKPMGNAGLLFLASFNILLTLLFAFLRLETIIMEDGIYIRFFPFHLSFKRYPWEQISRCYVRQYSPLTEYGGWGLRLGLFGTGWAYNVSGDKGLQLQFINGKKLLIGTEQPEELKTALTNLGRLNS